MAPDHPERTSWWYGLGLGYAERAVRAGGVADYDRAIDWLSRLHGELLESDPDRDFIAVLLMDAEWDRFYAVRYGGTCDTPTALAEAQRVVTAISGLAVRGDSELEAYARLLRCLAHLARFDEAGDRADLAVGIDGLTSALDTLTPDTPRYALAGSWLIDALRQRADLDEDPASLDVSIATGERVLSGCGPDNTAWLMLNAFEASAYQTRWRHSEDPADLDRAIELWRVVVEAEVDPSAAASCGDLLRQRAELRQDATDIAEAIRLLEAAARSASDVDQDAWLRWLELAQAHHADWQLVQAPESLPAAARCVDRSLALVPAGDADTRLSVHMRRVIVAFDELKYESSEPYVELPPAATRMRRCLSDAQSDLDRLVPDWPDLRAVLSTILAYGEMYLAAHEMTDIDLDRIRDLITHGAELSTTPPGWQDLVDTALGMVQYAEDAQQPGGPRFDGGVRDLIRVAAAQQISDVVNVARRVLPIALQARALWTGDRRGSSAAGSIMQRLGSDAAGWVQPDPADPEYQVLADLFRAFELGQQGDYVAVAEATERALATLDHLPWSAQMERTVRPTLHYLRAAALAGSGRPLVIDPVPGGPQDHHASTGQALGELVLTAGARLASAMAGTDLAVLREATARLAGIADRAQVGHPVRLMAGGLAGFGELQVAQRDPADRTSAARSATWFEELAAASSPDHPLWALIALSLAEGRRRAGYPDRARTRELGMSALRAHGRRVLLQAVTEHAIESARAASADAHKVAGWCLEDGAYDEAVAVLDAGRGLALRSATASHEMADRLARMGHDDLAEEWRSSAGFGRDQLSGAPLTSLAEDLEVPDDLRLRVLQVLESTTADSTDLLEPIDSGEIQRALASVGADALVYLVPASDACPGTAVVVPVSGPVDTIALPDLRADAGSLLAEYAQASGRRRDVGPASDVDRTPGTRLDDLCRWAWSAAMKRLAGYVGRWHLLRPARLVLVPMGSLGLVPWHAAYTDAGRGRRYAVHDIVFSYSVSARMFCTSAGRAIRSTESALIVGDPQGDLPFAGIEAQEIRNRFYPDGHYLGRPPADANGVGTPNEVLAWVTSADRGPSMLHFACHGRVDTSRPADAHLCLAGGTLAGRHLIEASRLAALDIDRVYLSACTTNVTGTDYDEAFSLATAFLAAGAHTVIGSLWSVPDEYTSVLMYLLHHHLHVESHSPVDALHQAQLWMLDPDRPAPKGTPPSLRRSFSQPHRAEPISWAAFTHLGR